MNATHNPSRSTRTGNAQMVADCETDICPTEYAVVLDKFAVDTNLLYIVTANYNEILPCLLEGREYTAEELMGAEFWADMPSFAQRQAHLCLKHMARMPGTRLVDMAIESINKTTFRINGGP